MPKYAFSCTACVIEFERTLKMGEHPSHVCPNCNEPADRVWENSGLAFGFKESPNAAPANSGVHKEDYPTADHIVGKDADRRRAQMNERDKVKAQARAQGNTHALIRHNHDNHIDYEPMSPTGTSARRSLAKAAIEKLRSQKAT